MGDLTLAGAKVCPTCGHVPVPKGLSSKDGINAAAFARLALRNFDARPSDVPGSYAAARKTARENAAAKKAARETARKKGGD